MSSRRRMAGVWATALACATVWLVRPAGAATVEEVQQAVEDIVEAGRADHRVIRAVGELPLEERLPLAKRLLDSPNGPMRYHTGRLLERLPPKEVAETFRKLLHDKWPSLRVLAATYLVKRQKDAEARALLLKEAASKDPEAAVPALRGIARVPGDDVKAMLVRVLEDRSTPKKILYQAITSAGYANEPEYVPALAKLLDRQDPFERHARDAARICDSATYALEQLLQINHCYQRSEAEKRDEAVARWKQWFGQQAEQPDPHPRETYVNQLVEESLTKLASSTDEQTRMEIKWRLQRAVRTHFCLGDLPGVDAVVGPSVRDLWKIMRVSGESQWYRYANSWGSLDTAFMRQFLPGKARGLTAPDEQAAAFLEFADTTRHSIPKLWIWSMCRDFEALFPKSSSLPKVKALKARLEAGFKDRREQVVLHGRIAQLEPLPKPKRPPGSMVPGRATALHMRLSEQPSNWSFHRDMIQYLQETLTPEQLADSRRHYVDHPVFRSSHSQRYPGSEWTYLSNAAYHWRVRKDAARALEFANKALILNDGNAKVHAIRGMIRVASKQSLDLAYRDLARAFQLDPTSLGDEPETPQAVAFLIEQALESGEERAATRYLEALGGLKAFRAEKPLRESEQFKKLVRRARKH